MIVDINKYKILYLYNADLDFYKVFTFNVKESNDKVCDEFTAQEILGTIGTDDMKITIFSDRDDNFQEVIKSPVVCTMYKESDGYKKFYVYQLFTSKEEVTAYTDKYLKEYNERVENTIIDLDKEINRLKESKEIYQSMIKDKEINFSEKYE